MYKRIIHLSASSISAFKACPTRFRLAYLEGIRAIEDTDAQRRGTNWHLMHEIYCNAIIQFTDYLPEDQTDNEPTREEWALEKTVGHINRRYADMPMPAFKTLEEWDLERLILVTSFVAYLDHWEDDPIEPILAEVPFDLPVIAPRSNLPLLTEEVISRGKIDDIAGWRGLIVNVERKSTSRDIDPSSEYWDRSKKDTQVSMYARAVRDMIEQDLLPAEVLEHLLFKQSIGNTLYDVWHVPTTKPKKISQKDTDALIETGEYFGQKFKVSGVIVTGNRKEGFQVKGVLTVDDTLTELTVGASGGISIKETPELYAARLLADYAERPDFYFQRKEIARTDQEIDKFRTELFNIYQAMRIFDETGCWYENEQQCKATFRCSYYPICYGRGSDSVCDGKTVPDGYSRKYYKDVTINEQPIEE